MTLLLGTKETLKKEKTRFCYSGFFTHELVSTTSLKECCCIPTKHHMLLREWLSEKLTSRTVHGNHLLGVHNEQESFVVAANYLEFESNIKDLKKISYRFCVDLNQIKIDTVIFSAIKFRKLNFRYLRLRTMNY